MSGSGTTSGGRAPRSLAMANVLVAGLALGYLARENREVLVAHLPALSLVVLVVVVFVVAAGRTLLRASHHVENILDAEFGPDRRR
ncbi:hypothetical protein [Amycolatopsis sp. CA-230715]|uniref:hypothetical protein n=1 Tax=Amycolatopsis sp. CA-230715 TaxID=2745196 RepID=UPI001C034F9C|nr:hypothetical protein [Amycolatopsis sp. CA-230715]QWF77281.1 hypothetical protein HUW46_00672 [Amycolatopsis sp. CA-230715]